MTKQELQKVIEDHLKWRLGQEGGIRANLCDANLCGADLRGADLRDADLRGADLRGADLNWQSHQLLSEILVRAAGQDVDKRKVAGLIRISTDWCWDKFLALNDPLSEWGKSELATWIKEDTPQSIKEFLQPETVEA